MSAFIRYDRRNMKILIAPDKFKNTLTALQVGNAISKGIKAIDKNVDIEICPLADGGEGSVDAIRHHLNLNDVDLQTIDAIGRPIFSNYYVFEKSAYIELASSSGLYLIEQNKRDILNASTRGTGKVIRHAIDNGATEIYLFVGGSATNDGGMGILYELGVHFYDKSGDELLPSGKNMGLIYQIDRSVLFTSLSKIKFTILVDVKNPFYGKNGAAHIFGKQKGASPNQIQLLNLALMNFAANIALTCYIDIQNVTGAGAAGGVAGGMYGILNAKIENGIDFISKILDLESKIKDADIVISGEGRLDHQSLQGKVITGVCKICKFYDRPLILMVGENKLTDEIYAQDIYAIMEYAQDVNDAMQNASLYLEGFGCGLEIKKYKKT